MPVEPRKSAAQAYEDEMQARKLRLHRARVENTRSCIDCGVPDSYRLVRRGGRTPVRNSERIYQIEHENHLLVERMSRIMNEESGLDNKNPCKGPASGKYLQRMRDLENLKIERENRLILARIENSKSAYPLEKMQRDSYKHAVLAARIGRFPRPLPPL